MKLAFLLRIKGHWGIPDGEWEIEGIIQNDSTETVEAGALELFKKQYEKTWRSRANTEFFDTVKISYSSSYITMKPGFRSESEDYFEYEIIPVLEIDERYFELKEVTP